jgi:hypothetical protein
MSIVPLLGSGKRREEPSISVKSHPHCWSTTFAERFYPASGGVTVRRSGGPSTTGNQPFVHVLGPSLRRFRAGRTGRGAASHKLVSHAEQIPQHIPMDAGQANEHSAIAYVVVCYVVNIRVRSEQLCAIIEIHSDDQRTGLSRAMSGDASQEFSVDLECRRPVRGALLDARQSKPDLPYGVEVDSASGHWLAGSWQSRVV